MIRPSKPLEAIFELEVSFKVICSIKIAKGDLTLSYHKTYPQPPLRFLVNPVIIIQRGDSRNSTIFSKLGNLFEIRQSLLILLGCT